jgi:hypothetical protein
MKNIFEPARVSEIRERIERVKADSERVWGTMTPAQMLEHCSRGMEMAVGDIRPPRKFIGRLLGPLIKPLALGNDEPMRRNSPTVDELVVKDDAGNVAVARERLIGLIDRFSATGPAGCTTQPHAFFGRLTPEQWAILMYKHLDHHLRQFGV